MNSFNLILDTDSYKSGHFLQYPPRTTKLVAYLESRGGIFEKTVFFGLQYILKKYLSQKVTDADVLEADAFFKHHKLPFNKEGWMYIVRKLNGKIPLKIYAVEEGSVVPTSNILMRIESTDPKCFWVVGWFETMLLRVWYPTTVATQSWYARKLIFRFLEKTADSPSDEVMFKLHDFGSRGVSSSESAAIGGAAHLVSFSGSDTIIGMICANEYYDASLAPSSIPAAEHSSIMVWGKDKEGVAFSSIFEELGKRSPLVALPADTYDTWNAIDSLWGKKLREKVKKSGVLLVVRTDSGNPPDVVLNALVKLEKAFGSTKNKKGYKVLNNVRLLHSDKLSLDMIKKILSVATSHKYSASNLVFGMGSSLLQKINRDTQKFVYKISYAEVDGKGVNVSKTPKTEPGKNSKSGYLDLILRGSKYQTVVRKNGDNLESELLLVYDNGQLIKNYLFDEVRSRANGIRSI
ncbi:MAG TPA: nicotinate phosphoribosyltransferase [Candidatus Saccharimonadales bacterium]|nr:nicotinate phosphoribosyltransferase [Candidatus Saccharimonadales bacterium]